MKNCNSFLRGGGLQMPFPLGFYGGKFFTILFYEGYTQDSWSERSVCSGLGHCRQNVMTSINSIFSLSFAKLSPSSSPAGLSLICNQFFTTRPPTGIVHISANLHLILAKFECYAYKGWNGRRPQFCWEMKDDLNFFRNGRWGYDWRWLCRHMRQ